MRHAFLAALAAIAAAFMLCDPASAQSIGCQQFVSTTINGAADTQLVAAPPAGQSNYVCDYEIGFSGAGTIYLETATASSCGGSLTQIANTWYGTTDSVKGSSSAHWRGLSTAALALCAHTTGLSNISITVYYSTR